jgi:RNA 2',3'-cyclic 3'-phosphodiesterase
MLVQLSLPGFDAPPPPSGTRPTHRLFVALFPQAHDAARIAEPIDALRQHHGLDGQRIHTDRLHVTLLSLGDYAGAVPQVLIDAAVAAAATVVHPPMDIVFDRALSFASRKAGNSAFVLCGRDTAAVSQLGQALGLALKRAGLLSQPSGKPHMTMLYDERVIAEHAIEPIRWTASEFVLVLSHLGKTRHDWLARWPLTRTR